MKPTTIQMITLISVIAFAGYELWYIPRWLKTISAEDAPIRTDLIIFPLIITVLLIISIIQYFRNRKKN